ncbi:MAG: S8 family serine peptidase, partial [Clostridia bacterium]|nr:S8 family serine peptidase [Clostridia bacterium]
ESKTDNSSINTDALLENLDSDGSLKVPFDEIYPEAISEGIVEFDDTTLLIKKSKDNAGISFEMIWAGVAKLETIFEMENDIWYTAKLIKGVDVAKTVEKLRALDEVEAVDYNYEMKTTAMAQAVEVPEIMCSNEKISEQWYMNYCGIPSGFGSLTKLGGSSDVVVAVIDTGVDFDHKDLKNNIWVNKEETPNNGIDDDNNGYIDDYYGVNVVSGKGNGDDDNGHGTHVAGIIAAENNLIGTVGIAFNTKIMPIKAAASSGYFLQSDIAKAILYAYENGAEVINMSLGGSACSQAVQDALSVAYSRCVLVASAGNDGKSNEYLPNYPAALDYVLGVMSVGALGVESLFTNYDGVNYSPVEYELYAPGEAIISTIPNDKYASWSGTSMAAPVVSAMAAILRAEYEDRDTYPTKYIYGQLASTSDDSAVCWYHFKHNTPNIVNLKDALTKTPIPNVQLKDYALFDTAGFEDDTDNKNNGDGVIDSGETIALGLTLINQWGMSKDTTVTIDTLTAGGMTD